MQIEHNRRAIESYQDISTRVPISICFPSHLGFRVGRFRETDSRARVLAVRDKKPGVSLNATWDAPSPELHGRVPRLHQFALARDAFRDPLAITRLRAVGSTVAFFQQEISLGEPTTQHGHNSAGDVFDAIGFGVIKDVAFIAGGAMLDPESDDFPEDVEYAIDALKVPKNPRGKRLLSRIRAPPDDTGSTIRDSHFALHQKRTRYGGSDFLPG